MITKLDQLIDPLGSLPRDDGSLYAENFKVVSFTSSNSRISSNPSISIPPSSSHRMNPWGTDKIASLVTNGFITPGKIDFFEVSSLLYQPANTILSAFNSFQQVNQKTSTVLNRANSNPAIVNNGFNSGILSSRLGMALPKAFLWADPTPNRFRVSLPASFLTSAGRVDFPKSNTVINVNYTGFTSAAQTAFQFAVDIWESLIDSSVPISINASFANLGANILGQAGPETFIRDFSGAPQANTWYPIALANSLSGQDLDTTSSDIGSEFNSNFNWYYGTDNNVPTNQYSFVSVVLHELAHGLGFLGLMNNQYGLGSWGYGTGFPGIYDRFTENGGGQSLLNTSLFPNPSAALGSQLTSNNIFFDGSNADAANGGNPVKLYAPSTWNGGSSYSHLDEIFNNTPNALMTYSGSPGESILNPGPVTLGIFKDMGWKLVASSTNPTLAIAATNANQTEGNSGTKDFTFTVNRSVNTTGTNEVNWAVTGSGTNPANAADFINGVLPSGIVSFAAGDTSKVITVKVQGDTTVEPNENFTVTLSNPTNGATITTATATGTIQNDDGNTGNTFSNTNPITIQDATASNPYPSTINVSGLNGNLASLKVTLTNLSHTWPDDIDALLVGPTGAKIILMSDVGGSDDLNNITLTFDPLATAALPDSGLITSGTYLPTDFAIGDLFNSPAPIGPYGTDFSVFNNTNPNGVWSLYIMDDTGGDAGDIAGGWSLTIGTTSTNNPTLAIAATNANQTEGNSGTKDFTFTVNRSVNTTGTNEVNWAVTGSGTNPANAADFINGVLPSGIVSFAAGDTSKVITVKVQGDTTVEPNENFTVTLSNPTNGATITTATATGTITNDDNNYTTIESIGNTSLIKDGANKLFTQVGSDTPVAVNRNGSQLYEGYAGWSFLAAETVNSTNQTLVKNSSLGVRIWNFDSNWDWTSVIGVTTAQIPIQETIFGVDADGDGTIGFPDTIVESVGNTSLIKDGANKLFTQVGSDTPVAVNRNGSQLYEGYAGWSFLAAETVNSTNQTLVKNLSLGVRIWNFDSNWDWTSVIGVTTAQIPVQETIFGVDANGDGIIGNPNSLNLTGTSDNDTLVGGANSDILTGLAGKDSLTGGLERDRFVYQTLTDSLLANYDGITDFNATNDLFLVDTARTGFNDAGAVATLDNAGISASLTNANFGANSAASFTFGSRSFVAINDATAGFQEADDAIIEVTGLTGTLGLGNFAIA
jgi:hypothetical protein